MTQMGTHTHASGILPDRDATILGGDMKTLATPQMKHVVLAEAA
jgi:hypothetical protein